MSEQTLITEAFTELAPSYGDTIDEELSKFWGISYRAFIDAMLEVAKVNPEERVLDIATGAAEIPLHLMDTLPGARPIFGLDITPAMLNAGRQDIRQRNHTGQIELVCASAMAMPFNSHSFDVAICALGTHHMNVPQMLAEVHRVLAIGGRMVISDVGATPFWRSAPGKLLLQLLMLHYGLSSQSARSKAEIQAFKNVRTGEEWAQLLTLFGFQHIKINSIKPRYPWYPAGLMLQAVV